jgi:hypothetical protein
MGRVRLRFCQFRRVGSNTGRVGSGRQKVIRLQLCDRLRSTAQRLAALEHIDAVRYDRRKFHVKLPVEQTFYQFFHVN